MLTRRLFVGGLLASTTAPAIIKIENAMRIVKPKSIGLDDVYLVFQRDVIEFMRLHNAPFRSVRSAVSLYDVYVSESHTGRWSSNAAWPLTQVPKKHA